MALMFQPFMRYADFAGRARRSEYWLWALFLFLSNLALTILQYGVMGAMAVSAAGSGHVSESGAAGMTGTVLVISLVKLCFWLAVLLPSIAVSVRRFHDTNRTGWWIIFPSVVSLVAFIIVISVSGTQLINDLKGLQGLSKSSDPTVVIAAIMSIIRPFMWVILPSLAAKIVTFVFRVMDGTPGPNRFGADPKGRGVTSANVF